MGYDMSSIKKRLEQSVPQVPTLSSDAQASLAKQSEQLKQLEQAGGQDIPVPTGLDEQQANQLTQTKEAAKDAQKQLQNMAIPALPALTDEQEKAMAISQTDLKEIQSQMSSPLAPPVPTIPSEVTNSLASIAVDEKYFKNNPTTTIQKPAAPSKLSLQASNSLMQPATIFKPKYKATPVRSAPTTVRRRIIRKGPSDSTGAGDPQTRTYPNTANKEIMETINRANAKLSQFSNSRSSPKSQVQQQRAPTRFTNFNSASNDRQLKSLSSTLSALNSLSTNQPKISYSQPTVHYNIPLTRSAKVADKSSDDLSTSRVKLMSNLASSLDDLGREFGENDISQEYEQEDATSALLHSRLQERTQRMARAAQHNNLALNKHSHLRHTGYTIGYPYNVQSNLNSDGMDSLDYLKNLKRNVMSMRNQRKY